MAANVESMVYAGETPWHGLGTRVPAELTSDEVDVKAGLNWRVDLKKIQVCGGAAIEGYKSVVRSSDRKVLGVVSDLYNPIQQETVRGVCDALVGEGKAVYHTAGSLNGGEDIWYLLKLPGDLVIGRDDLVGKFLLATNNHVGKRKFRILLTPIRVVCQNTLNAALVKGAREGVAISHFGDAAARLEQAVRTLKVAAEYYDRFGNVAKQMYAYRYQDTQLKALAATMFPARETEDAEEQPHWLVQRNRDKIIDLYENGKGHFGIRGTAWAAWNAVAEYTDWQRGKDENRTANAWFGAGAAMKQKAFEVIQTQMAA